MKNLTGSSNIIFPLKLNAGKNYKTNRNIKKKKRGIAINNNRKCLFIDKVSQKNTHKYFVEKQKERHKIC